MKEKELKIEVIGTEIEIEIGTVIGTEVDVEIVIEEKADVIAPEDTGGGIELIVHEVPIINLILTVVAEVEDQTAEIVMMTTESAVVAEKDEDLVDLDPELPLNITHNQNLKDANPINHIYLKKMPLLLKNTPSR